MSLSQNFIKIAACTAFMAAIAIIAAETPCDLREAPHGLVCACNATYCDYVDNPVPKLEHELIIMSSTKAGLRFDATTARFNVFKKFHIMDYDQRLPGLPTAANSRASTPRTVRLDIAREHTYQRIVGFGGAFTGAVSYLLNQLPLQVQDHLYKSYYSTAGIGYNLMRISIGGCDFDLAPWAYNELPQNDVQLSNFTLDARDAAKIEQIKRLIDVSGVQNLKVKGAAWSAPRWMKTNNAWTGSSRLKKEYFQTWADYHLKWLDMMEENGLPIWAISTGNEPLNGVLFMPFVKFMSMGWTPKLQAIWLADNLGPTLRNSRHKDLVIFGNDDQRYTFPKWFHMMKKTRSNAVEFLNGLAYHWYWDEIIGPSNLNATISEMPDKLMLVTESCIGDKPWELPAPLLGSWERGEKYVRDMLQNFQNGLQGWIDWNLILDERGGPNYADNYVDAPVIVNLKNPTEILKQPIFYAMGHFAKFIPEGSVRIASERSNINIDTVAFLRPDGTVNALIFNSGRASVDVTLRDSVRGTVVFNLPPRSIHSVIYQ